MQPNPNPNLHQYFKFTNFCTIFAHLCTIPLYKLQISVLKFTFLNIKFALTKKNRNMAKKLLGKNHSDLYFEYCSILLQNIKKNKYSNNWYLLCQDNLNEIMYPSYVQGRSLETAGRSTLDQYSQKVHENQYSQKVHDNQYSQKVHENFIQNKFNETGNT